MPTITTTLRPAPLIELRDWLGTTADRLRGAREFRPLARVEVARDIAADCLTEHRAIASAAHSAEVYDREALRLIGEATESRSPGGRCITPGELVPILAHIHRSADVDHDLAARATLSV